MMKKTREDNAEACKTWRDYKRTEEQRQRYARRWRLELRLRTIWKHTK